jgi:Zn-dependent peptidase ImmA (M78 family)
MERPGFVGSAKDERDPQKVAKSIRARLGLGDGWAAELSHWTEALRKLRAASEQAGILVASSGIVGSNTHRKLDRREFRGFVLVDEYAPLVFINAADYKAAQMFTLAHELAHVWFGSSAAFDLRDLLPAADATEQICDRTAAEFLVPEAELRDVWAAEARERAADRIQRVARHFRVSVLVAARRALDTGKLGRDAFFDFLHEYKERERARPTSEGGDFYNTAGSRIGERFARTVWQAVREGKLLYTEAYRLTDMHGETFERFFAQMQ